MNEGAEDHAARGGSRDEDWSVDEAFLAELRARVPYDPIPGEMVAAARAAFVWRTMDDELARLTYDSAGEERQLAGVRGPESARVLTFEAPTLTVEVEASPSGAARRLLGRLLPAQRGEVEVRQPGGSVTVEADEGGWFSAEGVAPGLVSLRCRGREPGATVVTDWILV